MMNSRCWCHTAVCTQTAVLPAHRWHMHPLLMGTACPVLCLDQLQMVSQVLVLQALLRAGDAGVPVAAGPHRYTYATLLLWVPAAPAPVIHDPLQAACSPCHATAAGCPCGRLSLLLAAAPAPAVGLPAPPLLHTPACPCGLC
jgi:hypothetical protein